MQELSVCTLELGLQIFSLGNFFKDVTNVLNTNFLMGKYMRSSRKYVCIRYAERGNLCTLPICDSGGDSVRIHRGKIKKSERLVYLLNNLQFPNKQMVPHYTYSQEA